MTITPATNYSKLSVIVDHACNVLGLPVNKFFPRFLDIAKWELSELKLDMANGPKTVLLPISDVNTVQLPSDCVDWTKIGWQSGQFIKTLSINGDLSMIDRTLETVNFSHQVSPGWLPNGVAVQDYGGGFEFLNYGGYALTAVGGGLPHEGMFQVKTCEDGCKEIYLANTIPGVSELYVEYISIGVNVCGDTIVDPYLKDYVYKCILATYEENMNPQSTEASIRRRKTDVAYAHTMAAGRTMGIDKETLLQITRKGYRLTEKA